MTVRHLRGPAVAAVAAMAAATTAARGAPGATATLFPWAVAPADQGATCARLLDPAEIVRASTGLMVFLDDGRGPSPVRASGVEGLARALASQRSGTPASSAISRGRTEASFEARDVGGPGDGGSVRCKYQVIEGTWRMISVTIVPPVAAAGAGR